ncbi:MAG: shikimate dehydrogenase [Panacagrimonas sp.]
MSGAPVDRYAVIGQPIAHSRSPLIHAAFARQTGQTLVYEAIEIVPASLAAELDRLRAEGLRGLNVTLPHKQSVAKLCEQVSARAQLAGAVNTLTQTDSGWRGDNTDGEGFVADLLRLGIGIAGRRVLVLGAGGATRGILAPLLEAAPEQLVVSNRNPWKPEELAEAFKPLGPVLPRTHIALKGDRYDLVINATSAGHAGGIPLLPGPLLAPGASCYDLSYGAAHAPFAAWAGRQNATRIADGLGMLVEQAASAFAIWRGIRPQVGPVLAMLREHMAAADADSEVTAAHQPVHRRHVEKPPQD